MSHSFTSAELEAYLDEALSPTEMAAVETAIRDNPPLLRQLAEINNRRDAGVHSLGAVWRRHRITCPTRAQLGSYLLGALDKGHIEYIQFHLDVLKCRYCQANLADLQSKQDEAVDDAATRRQRYFQSSAGYLQSEQDEQ